jgi:uncharacterized protein YciI
MKKLLLLFLFLSFGCIAKAQNATVNYDEALAKKLGADEYGMKQYVFVILKTGSVKVDDKKKQEELFRGHLENINKLAKEGKLVVAGPFAKNADDYRGIFILNVKTLEEAKTLLELDPAIKQKIFDVEMYQWYGSAALGEYLSVHEKIEKKKH